MNGQHTSDGGTHQAAFKEGIVKGINEYFKKSWEAQDVRDGMIGAVAVKIKDPVFESQTKNKLSNTEIRSWIVGEVKDAVVDYLLKHTDQAQKLNEKIQNNERLRKELNDVRKGAREAARKVSINIPKLKDCKYHLGQSAAHTEECEASMIFLTEGDSASGTITKTRDVKSQAVFPSGKNPECRGNETDDHLQERGIVQHDGRSWDRERDRRVAVRQGGHCHRCR